MTARRVLLCVGGGIAAYKMAIVTSTLVQRGVDVRVAMSRGAQSFVGRRTFEGLTGRPAVLSSTQIDPDGSAPHIAATRDLDALVIAPATADLCARLAAGVCDDAVGLAVVAASRCPRRILCPAMNDAMWEDAAVQANVDSLRDRGFAICGPAVGHLAEGYDAVGRMVEPEAIVDAVLADA